MLKVISIPFWFQDIIEKVQPLSPRVLIIDSIQTVYLKEVPGSAGGLVQVDYTVYGPAKSECMF